MCIRDRVIPKTAVVLRSGKQVVFTLKEGKAMWNYVHTGLENMEEYTVTDGLDVYKRQDCCYDSFNNRIILSLNDVVQFAYLDIDGII